MRPPATRHPPLVTRHSSLVTRHSPLVTRHSSLVTAIAVFAAIALTGCDKQTALHSNLEERQANLIIAALADEGISCQKTAGDEGMWNVMVSEGSFS